MSEAHTHNFCDGRHWLLRYLQIQLPYYHDNDGPLSQRAWTGETKTSEVFYAFLDWY